ncbi:MAG: MerR family transcriptional regulator [Bacteroidales bacterium]|nr:MerR family transcriptional regulator [Bacteroidales bacterium]
MEYTIQKLAKIAGVSTRTLRYYDEIGILKPARINSSGYRIYGQKQVDTLQQIMFYRDLGVQLEQIKGILNEPDFDAVNALMGHREKLLAKREQIDRLIANVNKTLDEKEGRTKMSDKEKFEGFKKRMIEENEKKYGKEIREKYGEETINASNAKMMNMTQEQYDAFAKLGEKLSQTLVKAMETGGPTSELAQKTADLHKQWLMCTWSKYTKEAHSGVAQLYVDDERFTAYYDKIKLGAAKFLRDALHIYTGMKK